MNGIDKVLICYGTLPNQKECEISVAATMEEIFTNSLSKISLLTKLSNLMEKENRGKILVVSSVAGDRGRRSNYIYGSSIAMLNTFISGLRQRLDKSGISLITIKPGYVDTPMTASFNKNIIWSDADFIGKKIASISEKNKPIVYLPSFWWAIMLFIKSIPENLYKKLKL